MVQAWTGTRRAWLVFAATAVLALLGSGTVHAAAPANDNFASAQVLAAGGGGLSTDTTSATKETGEPDHAGDTGGASVWFSWTPSSSGEMSISTTGSAFDTLLAVYTGSSVSSLTLVASNDDVSTAASASRVCFNATAGTPLRIAVDGYLGSSGALDLDWGSKVDSGPCPTKPPTLGGAVNSPTVGSQLTVTDGTWIDGGSEAVQWQRCTGGFCDAIAGATASSYTPTSRDVGNVIRADITSTSGAGSARNSAAPTAVVGMTPIGPQPNGRIITNGHEGTTWQIFSRFEDGSGLTQISQPGEYAMPAVSPDGRLVVYNDPSTASLRLSTTDGTAEADLPVQGYNPVWSPDGGRIAFVGGPFWETTVELFDLYTGTHTVLRTFNVEQVIDLAWSPDGRTLALTYNAGGQFDVAAIPADGRGDVTNLTNTPSVNDQGPAWSPTGDRISYTVGVPIGNAAGDADLWVMNANGSNQHKLVDSDAAHPIANSAWSPDGQKILYTEYDSVAQQWKLFVVAAAGGTPQLLAPTGDGDFKASWAPATTYTLTATVSGSGSISSAPSGVSCSSSCSADFADPTPVTLTATPATDSKFTGWSGDCSGTGPCVVTMNGYRDVTATFASTSNGGGGGGGGGGAPVDLATSISPSATTVPVGGSVTYRIAVTDKTAAAATGLHVFLTLPAGATVISSSTDRGSGCSATDHPGILDCDLNYLAANPTIGNILLVLSLSQAGQATLTASATSTQADINPADNTATSVVSVGSTTPSPPPPPLPPTPAPKPKLTPVPTRTLTAVRHATTETYNGAVNVNGRMKVTLYVTPLHSTKRLTLLATARLGATTLRTGTRLLHATTRGATRVDFHLAFRNAALKRGNTYVISITGTDAAGRHATVLMRFKA